jgi:hypothetical protein
MRHELATLAALIDREVFEREWAGSSRRIGNVTVAGGGAAVSAACLPIVGRGGRRAVIPEGPLRECVQDMLALVGRLLHQGPKSRGRIYARHEPVVECISKGKARKRPEFGTIVVVKATTKVSLATTIDEGFVVGMRALPGNPCDGHTLPEALEQVATLTRRPPRWPSSTADTAATA